MRDYATILDKGKENAIKTNVLMDMLGFDSKQNLKREIAQAREDGQIILSCIKGGYYLPKDNAEIEEWINTLTKRAETTLYTLENAKKYLDNVYSNNNMGNCDD